MERKFIFNSFLTKLKSDLNTEVLKKESHKKIIKRSTYFINNNEKQTRDLLVDYNSKNIYGLLNGGRIAKDAILETPVEIGENEFKKLDGERIYNDFFFLLHISFKCNVARLFIIKKSTTVDIDSVLKSYLKTNLFKHLKTYKPVRYEAYLPPEYKEEVINRSLIKTVTISKGQNIEFGNTGDKFEVEIKLKSKNSNLFNNVTSGVLSAFKKAKLELGNNILDDEDDSFVTFNIKDPNTNSTKSIVFGGEGDFEPKFFVSDEDVLNDDETFNVINAKDYCMKYINYNGDILS